jgi:hypothetical protein
MLRAFVTYIAARMYTWQVRLRPLAPLTQEDRFVLFSVIVLSIAMLFVVVIAVHSVS